MRLYNEHLLVKEPGSDAPTPWHQDLPYFLVAGDQCCSLWLALDDVTAESGAMRFVRGSHRWGRTFRTRTFRAGDDLTDDGDEFDGSVPDVEAAPGDYDLIGFDLSPGDCTVHHGLTLHGAPANRSADRLRRGTSYRFVGEAARYRTRRFAAPLPEPVDLAEGAPLDAPLFPELWRAEQETPA